MTTFIKYCIRPLILSQNTTSFVCALCGVRNSSDQSSICCLQTASLKVNFYATETVQLLAEEYVYIFHRVQTLFWVCSLGDGQSSFIMFKADVAAVIETRIQYIITEREGVFRDVIAAWRRAFLDTNNEHVIGRRHSSCCWPVIPRTINMISANAAFRLSRYVESYTLFKLQLIMTALPRLPSSWWGGGLLPLPKTLPRPTRM